jgi:hypothetical protein
MQRTLMNDHDVDVGCGQNQPYGFPRTQCLQVMADVGQRQGQAMQVIVNQSAYWKCSQDVLHVH